MQGITLMICGVFWLGFALCQHTRNFKSSLIYKILPFFTGLAAIVCAADSFGWVSIFRITL